MALNDWQIHIASNLEKVSPLHIHEEDKGQADDIILVLKEPIKIIYQTLNFNGKLMEYTISTNKLILSDIKEVVIV